MHASLALTCKGVVKNLTTLHWIALNVTHVAELCYLFGVAHIVHDRSAEQLSSVRGRQGCESRNFEGPHIESSAEFFRMHLLGQLEHPFKVNVLRAHHFEVNIPEGQSFWAS